MRASSIANEILDLLRSKHDHLTEVEIYNAVKAKFTAVNHSTVYRALRRLVDNGDVSITDIGQGAQVFEYSSGNPHHHLICQSCGKIINLTDGKVEGFFEEIEKRQNFKVITKHLALFGYCDQCQKSQKNPA
jgi:Fur family ferric uptake transcriptional regulator